jgi:hypothetical protein
MGAQMQRIVALALVPAAAAVAGALVYLRLHYQPPTVPEYRAVGNDGGPHDIDRGGRFDLELRPQAPVEGAIWARAFLIRVEEPVAAGERSEGPAVEPDRVRPWDPPVDVLRDGTVRIAGPSAALFAGVPDGPWDVAVSVGRPEMLPTAPRDILEARAREHGGATAWRLVVERVLLEPDTHGQ